MSNSDRQQKIAIIGGGLAGLTAAYDLTRGGGNLPSVTVFEAREHLGGLAAGFKGRDEWDWPLEHFYHHIFTNDDDILGLVDELGLTNLVDVHSPVTSMFFEGKSYAFDSPLRLLAFPHLPMIDKLRMGFVIAYLRYHPKPPWRSFDEKLADEWLLSAMGQRSYAKLWQPMLEGKFDTFYDRVNLAWFWARIVKRTKDLGYFKGGFQSFVDGLAAQVEQQDVSVHRSTFVQAVRQLDDGTFEVTLSDGATHAFDVVLSTVSPGLMSRLAPDLPSSYLAELNELESMGAVVLTVALDRQLLTDGTYWVNVPKPAGLPFLALVEHTNMVSAEHYGGDRLLYIGNYLKTEHRHFDMSAEDLLEEFLPHLATFNPDFDRSWVTGAWVHAEKYAQPVPTVGYKDKIPAIRTPLAGLYFASMSQVYPWDRGTNYAVEMGRNVAKIIQEDVAHLSKAGKL